MIFPSKCGREARLRSLGPPCICACTHTRGRTTKASYFTGTVAISVNTIKPSAHVPRLRPSRGVWKYVQEEAYTRYSRAEPRTERERAGETREECPWTPRPKLPMESFALWPFVYIGAKVLRATRAREECASSRRESPRVIRQNTQRAQ